jgi:hypothetical protein
MHVEDALSVWHAVDGRINAGPKTDADGVVQGRGLGSVRAILMNGENYNNGDLSIPCAQ